MKTQTETRKDRARAIQARAARVRADRANTLAALDLLKALGPDRLAIVCRAAANKTPANLTDAERQACLTAAKALGA